MTHSLPAEAAAIVELLQLEPLPLEGGYFRRTYADEYSTAIYYLLAGSDFSALHRLDATEVYHWYAGAPLSLLLLDEQAGARTVVLGPDLQAGQRPQIVVGPGVWQGSSSLGDWTLIGTSMAPGFHWEGFELADAAALARQYPGFASRIAALGRDEER